MEQKLWYKNPAQNWNEALPLGNGSLGAMVHGGCRTEKISLNHDTLWSGYPKNQAETSKTEAFKAIQQLAMQKNYAQAEASIEANLSSSFTEGYLPLGDLNAAFSIGPDDDSASQNQCVQYERGLFLDSAQAYVSYKMSDASFERQFFVSYPHQALFMRFTSTKKHDCRLTFSTPLRHSVSTQNNMLVLDGLCPSHVRPSYLSSDDPVRYDPQHKGISYCAVLLPRTDGTVSVGDDFLDIQGASSIELMLVAETSFVSYATMPDDPQKNYITRSLGRMAELQKLTFEQALAQHQADYTSLYSSCAFTLGQISPQTSPQVLPTDERLRQFHQAGSDIGLYQLLFNFGRYLMIASSRQGSQCSNLQGIWNKEVRPPWSSNYTVNINTQMNYWPVYAANLSACASPFIEMMKDLAVAGQKTARQIYGAAGSVVHHNTDLWRSSQPVGEQKTGSCHYSFWPLGYGWLCRTVFEYFEYTMDTDFLLSTALPLLKSGSDFFLDVLTPDDDGTLLFCPSTSPENRFLWQGKKLSLSKTTTMTMSIIQDLLQNTALCCKMAHAVQGSDDLLAYQQKLEAVLARLPGPMIGSDGRLLEWYDDVPEADPLHRHVSHLYALHPAQLIDVEKDASLADACKKSLEARGDAGTGWSLAWKINLWARLCDGNRAEKLLSTQLNPVGSAVTMVSLAGGTYPNLFCAHPPFQIDGNFGLVSGICEMLLQSTLTDSACSVCLRLLPALPDAWQNGAVSGIVGRGGYTISLRWADMRLQGCCIQAGVGGACRIRYKNLTYEHVFAPQEKIELELKGESFVLC